MVRRVSRLLHISSLADSLRDLLLHGSKVLAERVHLGYWLLWLIHLQLDGLDLVSASLSIDTAEYRTVLLVLFFNFPFNRSVGGIHLVLKHLILVAFHLFLKVYR